MKKVLGLLILTLLSLNIYAQLPRHIKKGDYLKSRHLEKFTGTWQRISGRDTFTISLKFKLFTDKALGLKADMLTGNYKIVKNGAERFNTFKMAQESNKVWVTAMDDYSDTTSQIAGINLLLLDPKRKRQRRMILVISPQNSKAATLKIDPTQERIDSPNSDNDLFYSNGVTMSKIN